MVFLYHASLHVYPAIWSFYTIEAFGWSVGQVGLSLAVYGALSGLSQAFAIRPAVRLWGQKRATLLALAADAAGAAGLAFATQGWMIYALMPLLAISAIAAPALTAMMSAAAPDDRQGELQGVIAGLAGIAAVVSPPVMTGVFDAFVGEGAPVHAPGAPFLLAAAMIVAAGFLLASARRV